VLTSCAYGNFIGTGLMYLMFEPDCFILSGIVCFLVERAYRMRSILATTFSFPRNQLGPESSS
jgi:hypothetical protein